MARTGGDPMGERVRALEEKLAGQAKDIDRIVTTVTAANTDHFETLRGTVSDLSKHITAETNRWLKAFYWIAFSLMTVGGVTVGNTKFLEKLIETFFK